MNTQEKIAKIKEEASVLCIRLYNLEEERKSLRKRMSVITVEFQTLNSIEEKQEPPKTE